MIVTVVDYDPKWITKFKEESEILRHILGEVICEIHHIGSTAVPGLMAKPIIDMMLDVKDLIDLDTKNSLLENLGYEAKGELGIKGRRYFRKGGDHRTHQIHAFKSGDPHLMRHLAFRDYLRAHDQIAKEYGELKSDIAKRSNNDIEHYCDEKDPYVKHHEKIAMEWHQTVHS